jgi:cytochrome c1
MKWILVLGVILSCLCISCSDSRAHAARWIEDPQAVNRLTVMPNVHATPEDARDMATYLSTLK